MFAMRTWELPPPVGLRIAEVDNTGSFFVGVDDLKLRVKKRN